MLSDLLLWNKIGRIVVLLAKRLNIDTERAFRLFYTSKVCDDLHNPETQLYLRSDSYIVEDTVRELQDR